MCMYMYMYIVSCTYDNYMYMYAYTTSRSCSIETVVSLQATAVMDSFKSSFMQALSSSPTSMCDTCPLKQLHSLCQNLEGESTVCVCVCV